MVLALSFLAAVVCTIVATFIWVSIRGIRFRKNGRSYQVDAFEEYLYTIQYGRLKFAAGTFVIVLCVSGLVGSVGVFLLEIGLPFWTVVKIGGFFACWIGGSYLYFTAKKLPPAFPFKFTLAEVTRQGLYVLGMLGKGGAWLMLYWILVDWNVYLAALSGIAGIFWALINMRKI